MTMYKCLSAKMSVGQKVVWPNVSRPKCLSAKCFSTKRRGTRRFFFLFLSFSAFCQFFSLLFCVQNYKILFGGFFGHYFWALCPAYIFTQALYLRNGWEATQLSGAPLRQLRVHIYNSSFSLQFRNWPNKLECFSLVSLSS
jgi:hypothetical protein